MVGTVCRPPRPLRPRPAPKNSNQDVLVLLDGSSSICREDFEKEKRAALALSALLTPESEMGVIQFSSFAAVVSPLPTKREDMEKQVQEMTQIKTGTNLKAGLELAAQEFALSKYPTNAKYLWIITDGEYEDPNGTALLAQQLKRKHKATIFCIGVGPHVTLNLLERVSSEGCSFLVKNFDMATKVIEDNLDQKELSCQISGSLVFSGENPMRLGEDVLIRLELENTGVCDIPARSRVLFRGNDYFNEKSVLVPERVMPGQSVKLDAKLTPRISRDKGNLDRQILALQEELAMYVVDNRNNLIFCNISGFYLNLQDFSGDVYDYKPQLGQIVDANIVTFGPPGAGKSSFVNGVCTTLGDKIITLNVTGATREVVTATLLRFNMDRIKGFENLRFAVYDIPGLDGKNYKGDEIPLILNGLMPFDIDFKSIPVKYEHIKGRRDPVQEERKRRAHVVAFFVPQGSANDSDLMAKLAEKHYQITVEHKRKAIVVISHADEIEGEEARKEVLDNVCQKLAIDSTNVFFLENYVDKKDKQFSVDKNILRIILALLSRADDFMQFDQLNPVACPWNDPAPQATASAPPAQTTSSSSNNNNNSNGTTTSTAKCTMANFLRNLPAELHKKVADILKEEDIDDDETLHQITSEEWRTLNFKLGEIKKIEKAMLASP